MFPASVSAGGATTGSVIIDGDTLPIGAVNTLDSPLVAGDRVFVDFVGDSGVYVTGRLGPVVAPWVVWTPTIGGWVAGNAVFDCAYQPNAGFCHVRFGMTVGSSTTFGAALTVTPPVAAVGEVDVYHGMAGTVTDTSASVTAPVEARYVSSLFRLYALTSVTEMNNSGLISTVPHTWAVNDRVDFWLTYQTG